MAQVLDQPFTSPGRHSPSSTALVIREELLFNAVAAPLVVLGDGQGIDLPASLFRPDLRALLGEIQ